MRSDDPESWVVTPLAPALGARVEGPDLASGLDGLGRQTVLDLLFEHHVLAFPDQDITVDRHVEFAEIFGDPYVHPYLTAVPEHPAVLQVLKEETDTDTFGGEYWHADISFTAPPAAASILRAIEIPPLGGDTLFANQHLAFDRLSPGMQALLSGLSAVHTYPGKTEAEASAIHPVVRVHPITERPSLYVNPAFVSRFDRMTVEESTPLLQFLFDHQTRPEFQCRLGWTEHQVAVWDNLAVQHYALNDYPGQRRRLERVTAMERTT